MRKFLLLLPLILTACGGAARAKIVNSTPNVIIVRQEPGHYLIYSRSTSAARDSAYDYLRCRERLCVLGTGGYLLTVEVPSETGPD